MIVFPLPAFAFILHEREMNDDGEVQIKEEVDYRPAEVQFISLKDKPEEEGEQPARFEEPPADPSQDQPKRGGDRDTDEEGDHDG